MKLVRPAPIRSAPIRSAPICSASIACALALIACGGGPSLREDVYRDPETTYRIGTLRDGWRPMRIPSNDLAWHHDALGAIVQVNGRCDPDNDVPLTALTNHLLIGFTARDLRSEELVPLDGREALRTHVVASLDGVPRELLLFVLKKDDCTYDFALIAPPGSSFEQARPIFEAFVRGFTTEVGR
ncbi:MAG: hypothetical protein K8H88_24830 [Sandaracinaceae bacterium]|nr:hypothetical protein [Sandaracinaceae bacterium]